MKRVGMAIVMAAFVCLSQQAITAESTQEPAVYLPLVGVERPLVGRIAFVYARAGQVGIGVMNADGSERRDLAGTSGADFSPEWSPDGEDIAFVSKSGGDSEIFTMSNDGTEVTRLTHNPGIDQQPLWSPDGQYIAFESASSDGLNVHMIRPDGSDLNNVTMVSAVSGYSWSWDSKRIAFMSTYSGNGDIYVVNTDGTGLHSLTVGADVGQNGTPSWGSPAWSPVGDTVAFALGDGSIWSAKADGSDLQKLTSDTSRPCSYPVWSPNGCYIAFTCTAAGDTNIYLMKADGSDSRQLTYAVSPALAALPTWSPDSSRIAFQYSGDGTCATYSVVLGGGEPKLVATHACGPVWGPG